MVKRFKALSFAMAVDSTMFYKEKWRNGGGSAITAEFISCWIRHFEFNENNSFKKNYYFFVWVLIYHV